MKYLGRGKSALRRYHRRLHDLLIQQSSIFRWSFLQKTDNLVEETSNLPHSDPFHLTPHPTVSLYKVTRGESEAWRVRSKEEWISGVRFPRDKRPAFAGCRRDFSWNSLSPIDISPPLEHGARESPFVFRFPAPLVWHFRSRDSTSEVGEFPYRSRTRIKWARLNRSAG